MRTRIAHRLVTLPLAIAVAATPATALAQSPTAQDEVVMRIGTTLDMTTANPFGANAGSDWITTTTQYDMLLKFSSEDLSPAPSLAEGCTPSEDSMTWTCTLRDGLRWSDGTPLTSRDVAFTYRFAIDNKIPQYRPYFPFDPTFETPDERTLIWRSTRPTFAPDMPPWVYIVPEHVWAPYDGKDRRTILNVRNVPSVASGPFVLTEWTKGSSWTMERNVNFWGPEPVVDRLEFRVYSNEEAMAQALLGGEIDVADGFDATLIDRLQADPNVTVHEAVSDWWLNLAFNFGGQGPDADPLPALKDHDVRKAIAMAIDKQAIADKVYLGTADPGDTIIRQASAYWHLDIPAEEEIPYDPQGAAALLDQAGYRDTDGDGVREDPETGQPLRLRMPASTDTPGAVDAGRLIAGFLSDVGIEVRLLPSSDAKMGDYWGAGNFDAYIWYWSGDPDPDYQLSVFTSDQCGGWSDGCWKDPYYDRLYERQREVTSREERLQIVQEAQRYVYEQLPNIVLAYPSWLQAYRNDRFTGWTPAPGERGYLLPSYNYDGLLTVRPVEAAAPPARAGLPAGLWVAVAAVVVAVVAAIVLRGRRVLDEEA